MPLVFTPASEAVKAPADGDNRDFVCYKGGAEQDLAQESPSIFERKAV